MSVCVCLLCFCTYIYVCVCVSVCICIYIYIYDYTCMVCVKRVLCIYIYAVYYMKPVCASQCLVRNYLTSCPKTHTWLTCHGNHGKIHQIRIPTTVKILEYMQPTARCYDNIRSMTRTGHVLHSKPPQVLYHV